MKKIIPFVQIIFVFIALFVFRGQAFSQISVVSTDGYAVNVSVTPVSIVLNSPTCVNGYNYNVKMKYAITMTGRNVPASLYTLQGTLGCSSTNLFFDLPNNGGSGETVTTSNPWTSAKDCNTATVMTKSCNTVNLQIHGPGISNRVISFAASNVVLGIKLLDFKAEAEKATVKLNWSTASETNNDYFTIERSADGTQWSEVKRTKGAGNSSNTIAYQAYDESPVAGTAYYRLKQTDFDGQTSYSSTQTVKYSPAKEVSVFPVPNTGNTITITGITEYKNHDLTVINAGGNVVYTTTLARASVNLPELKPGMYILKIKNKMSGTSENLRYVKM